MKMRLTVPIAVATIVMMVFVLFLSGKGAVEASSMVNEKRYSLEELQEDFSRVRTAVENKHPMFFANEEEIYERFDRQYALLQEGMSELDFYRVLAPALAALDCGHSNVLLSESYESYLQQEGSLLPLKVTVLEQKLYVVESKGTVRIPAGSQIVSINDRSSREMLETIYSSVSSDGGIKTRIDRAIQHQFPFLYHTLIDRGGAFEVVYRLPDRTGDPGEIRSTALQGLSFSELRGEKDAIASIDVLIDMEEIRSDYGAEIYDDYALLTVGSFILKHRDFALFLEEFFLELQEKRIDTLVLDLRGNWGGTPKPAALLLAHLTSRPVRYLSGDAPFYMFNYKRAREPEEHAFTGTVYALVDGSCFSTSAHFVSLLKQHDIATLIGEETGGSAACSDAKRRIVLPNTGLRVYYSTRVFTTAVEGFARGKGIAPDYAVGPTTEDIAQGRDSVAEFAAKLATE